jgi:hypothetical protein
VWPRAHIEVLELSCGTAQVIELHVPVGSLDVGGHMGAPRLPSHLAIDEAPNAPRIAVAVTDAALGCRGAGHASGVTLVKRPD